MNDAGESKASLSAHDVRSVSVSAVVCPITVRRYLRGQPIRSTTQVRIEQALRELGHGHLVAGGDATKLSA